MERLGNLQLIAVRPAHVIDPCSFVHASGVDDERIVVDPFPNGVAVPSRLHLLRKWAPISPDVPPGLAVLINDLRLIFVLPKLNGAEIEELDPRKPDWVAGIKRIVCLRNRNRSDSPAGFMRLPHL